MASKDKITTSENKPRTAREWMQALAPYHTPSHIRSAFELGITIAIFIGLWIAAWWALSVSIWLSLALSIPAGGFLLRLFSIQHDCGHGSFFRTKALNDWVGRILGIFTFTPYDVWRRAHAMHHGSSGHLVKRGFGDIDTLTVAEYMAMSPWRRFTYRLYRHPLVLFGIGPSYNFLIRNRLPMEFLDAGWRYWISAMGTNLALAAIVCGAIYLVGIGPILMVQLPITLLATTAGVWLFYVQHQYEDTYWAHDEDWNLCDAALKGSSYYVLPKALEWLTAHINIHHVHHLNSRIPSYRLPQVMRDFPELANAKRLTLWESFSCARLALWDEGRKKLVSFSSLKRQQRAKSRA